MGGGSESSGWQASQQQASGFGDSYGYQVSNSASRSTSQSSTLESAISKQQAEILASREEIFDTDFLPNWQTAYKEIDNSIANARKQTGSNIDIIDNAIAEITYNSPAMKSAMALQSNQINNAFQATQKQTAQNLAKQNLLGTSSGVTASLQGQNERARSSALAEAYYNTVLQNDAKKTDLLSLRNNAVNSALAVEEAAIAGKQNALNILGTMMAKPTSDVAYHSQAKSESYSQGSSIGENASHNESQSSGSSYGTQKSKSVQVG